MVYTRQPRPHPTVLKFLAAMAKESGYFELGRAVWTDNPLCRQEFDIITKKHIHNTVIMQSPTISLKRHCVMAVYTYHNICRLATYEAITARSFCQIEVRLDMTQMTEIFTR